MGVEWDAKWGQEWGQMDLHVKAARDAACGRDLPTHPKARPRPRRVHRALFAVRLKKEADPKMVVHHNPSPLLAAGCAAR